MPKVLIALAAFCVALLTPLTSGEGIEDIRDVLPHRSLRHASAHFAAAPVLAEVNQDSTNPLRRRDQSLVSNYRVYDPVSGLACFLVGKCVACLKSEREESYCRETGYRQELDCPRPKDLKDKSLHTKPEDERQTRFKACSTVDDYRPGLAVIKFEAVMSLLLIVSFVLLRRERGKQMSSFDLRKDPRQRVGLLNGAATNDKSSD